MEFWKGLREEPDANDMGTGGRRVGIRRGLWISIHIDELIHAKEGEAGLGEGFFGLGGGGFGVGFEEGELALVEGGEALFLGGSGWAERAIWKRREIGEGGELSVVSDGAELGAAAEVRARWAKRVARSRTCGELSRVSA